MRRYQVTYGSDGRPKIHRDGCRDVARWESRTGDTAWTLEATTARAAMFEAGAEQRQVNTDPTDMDEDPGADVMPCIGGLGT